MVLYGFMQSRPEATTKKREAKTPHAAKNNRLKVTIYKSAMKAFSIVFLILLLASCKQRTSLHVDIPSASLRRTDIYDNPVIVGSWTMCTTLANGIMTQYNICPKVVFKSDGTGYVGNDYSSNESFKWKSQNGHLDIVYGAATSNKTFPDTFYTAVMKPETITMNLTINQSKKGNSYYLSK